MQYGLTITLILVEVQFLLAEEYFKSEQPTAFVCECSKDHCANPFDTAKLVADFSREGAVLYRTSDGGDRLARSQLEIHTHGDKSTAAIRLIIDRSWKFQKIIGFGGAMTDATALNIDRLKDESMQQRLLEAYFAGDGLGYNILRIPMASCDFSTHEYSYADKDGDFDLVSFKLAEEDEWKQRHTKNSMAISKAAGRQMMVFASPWSAPGWMKTNGHMKGGGSLKEGDRFWKTWANYFVKFIELYTAAGVPIWAITTQNEPSTGTIPDYGFQTMSLPPAQAQSFIRDWLHPAMSSSGMARDTQIIIHDDFRDYLPSWPDQILSDPAVDSVVAGIGVHWYHDRNAPPVLTKLTRGIPSSSSSQLRIYIILREIEACIDDTHGVRYGNFSRAMRYAKDGVEDLNHWVSGWVDWNIVLDMQGGPNWVSNFVDSPVIVDEEKQTFYKQPMFYALGQFSRFLEPDAIRVAAHPEKRINGVDTVAFQNPNGTIAVVLLNYNAATAVPIRLVDGDSSIPVNLEPMSINTVIYRLPEKKESSAVSISLDTSFTLLSLFLACK